MFGRTISRWSAIRKAISYTQSRKMNTEKLSTSVQDAIKEIAAAKGFSKYALDTKAISGAGENSYGLVLQAKISCKEKSVNPFYCVLKIAPMNAARRAYMKVVEYYQREVFMYNCVLKAFGQVQDEEKIPPEHAFNEVPKIYFSSLKNSEEFIIFEDLAQSGFIQNSRLNLPTYDLTVSALKALSRFHAMSFVMQAKRPKAFDKLISEIRYKDNLFTPNMDQVAIEFARKYIRRTKAMIAEDKHHPDRDQLLQVVEIFEDKFKEIAMKAVDGGKCAPYSVICHGDFWNNNILYRYDEHNNPSAAKLVDFQLSRYASPVLDILHFLFVCTEKELRDAHFPEFVQIYHDTLAEHLRRFDLDPDQIYPRAVLDSQLKTYGPYGFCMAIFAIPFFICDSSNLPNFDKVSEAINELSSEGSDGEERNNNVSEMAQKSRVLIDEYELLNERTKLVFKKRIIGIVEDLFKYNMVKELRQFYESEKNK